MSEVIENATPEEGQAVALLVFANDKSQQHTTLLQGLLKMVYHSVLTNRVAVMQAKNKDTGQEEVILVGVEQTPEGVNCFPLFVPIKAEDVGKYVAPDGSGGWIE